MNKILIHLARLDTCSVCNNERNIRVDLVSCRATAILPCPLCSDASELGAWLERHLEVEPA